MCELYFDNVKDILEACNTAKPLSDCEDVLCLLKDENIQGNPYRLLAERFQKYNEDAKCKDAKCTENDDDCYFYQYLNSLEDKMHYNFPIKVRECVSLGLYSKIGILKKLKKSDWQKVDDALKLVGLEKFSNRQISELSGGQFQRVLIARCLVQEAKYIFLDEPFVGIDSVSEEIIMETLRDLRDKGHTILIVHHDLRKVHSYFDSVLLLNKEVIAFGDTESTFTRVNLTTAYGTDLFFTGGENND